MNKEELEAIVEMLNRRINNHYILVDVEPESGPTNQPYIVNTVEKHIIAPGRAALKALLYIASTSRELLLEELDAKCDLNDKIHDDLILIYDTLSVDPKTPNCYNCKSIAGSQCGYEGSGIGDGEQAKTCDDYEEKS